MKKDPLMNKILEYLTIIDLPSAIVDSADLIIRMRLGQVNSVANILKKYCKIGQEGRGVNIEEPLYKAIELGEYLRCYQKFGECKDAKDCWITRKGFCDRWKGKKSG